jgi:hypothetical protein
MCWVCVSQGVPPLGRDCPLSFSPSYSSLLGMLLGVSCSLPGVCLVLPLLSLISSNYSDFLKRHLTLIKKYFWHFSWLLYLYTFSLYENASLIIFSAETEYISTRYWYRNINFLKANLRVRRVVKINHWSIRVFLSNMLSQTVSQDIWWLFKITGLLVHIAQIKRQLEFQSCGRHGWC